MDTQKGLEKCRRDHGIERKNEISLLGQNEDQIANLCPLRDVLNSRVHAVRHEAGTLSGICCALHKEGGITQGSSGFLRFECLRNVPAQGTEARFWFDTNWKTR